MIRFFSRGHLNLLMQALYFVLSLECIRAQLVYWKKDSTGFPSSMCPQASGNDLASHRLHRTEMWLTLIKCHKIDFESKQHQYSWYSSHMCIVCFFPLSISEFNQNVSVLHLPTSVWDKAIYKQKLTHYKTTTKKASSLSKTLKCIFPCG